MAVAGPEDLNGGLRVESGTSGFTTIGFARGSEMLGVVRQFTKHPEKLVVDA